MTYTPTIQTVRVRMADKKALFTHTEVQLVFDWANALERALQAAMVALMKDHPEVVAEVERLAALAPRRP